MTEVELVWCSLWRTKLCACSRTLRRCEVHHPEACRWLVVIAGLVDACTKELDPCSGCMRFGHHSGTSSCDACERSSPGLCAGVLYPDHKGTSRCAVYALTFRAFMCQGSEALCRCRCRCIHFNNAAQCAQVMIMCEVVQQWCPLLCKSAAC